MTPQADAAPRPPAAPPRALARARCPEDTSGLMLAAAASGLPGTAPRALTQARDLGVRA